MMIDKEAIYDEKISPLVNQIVDICKQENIPFLMDFALREKSGALDEIYCFTAIYGQPGMMETPTFPRSIKILRGEPECFGVRIQRNNE